MHDKHYTVNITCVFCGRDKVVQLKHFYVAIPKCDQCGCDHMFMKPIGSFAKFITTVRKRFAR
jgi:transcription elongation factor Elf1